MSLPQWGVPVQMTGAGSVGQVASLPATFGSACTVGNVVLVLACCQKLSSAGNTGTVTDQNSNTYTQLATVVQRYQTSTAYITFFVYALVVPSGSGIALTPTFTPDSTNFCNIAIMEIPVTNGYVPSIDGAFVSLTFTATAAPATPYIVTSGQLPALFLGFGENNTTVGRNLAAGAGYTQIFQNNYVTSGSTTLGSCFEYAKNVRVGQAAPFTMNVADTGTVAGCSLILTPAAKTFTLAGPGFGTTGVASSNFTLTPSATLSDTISLSDGASGTFTPSSLTFTSSSVAQTFTYTPASTGVKTLTLTSGNDLAITNNPWTYSSLSGAPTTANVWSTVAGQNLGFPVGASSVGYQLYTVASPGASPTPWSARSTTGVQAVTLPNGLPGFGAPIAVPLTGTFLVLWDDAGSPVTNKAWAAI